MCVCVCVTCARASYVCLSYNNTSCLCACANMRAACVDSTYDIIMLKSTGQNDVCLVFHYDVIYMLLLLFNFCLFKLLSFSVS